jgi:hypothetical protein
MSAKSDLFNVWTKSPEPPSLKRKSALSSVPSGVETKRDEPAQKKRKTVVNIYLSIPHAEDAENRAHREISVSVPAGCSERKRNRLIRDALVAEIRTHYECDKDDKLKDLDSAAFVAYILDPENNGGDSNESECIAEMAAVWESADACAKPLGKVAALFA